MLWREILLVGELIHEVMTYDLKLPKQIILKWLGANHPYWQPWVHWVQIGFKKKTSLFSHAVKTIKVVWVTVLLYVVNL